MLLGMTGVAEIVRPAVRLRVVIADPDDHRILE
jgi:hypothetical protein